MSSAQALDNWRMTRAQARYIDYSNQELVDLHNWKISQRARLGPAVESLLERCSVLRRAGMRLDSPYFQPMRLEVERGVREVLRIKQIIQDIRLELSRRDRQARSG